MGQVTVTLNGKTYRLRCGDGEEQRLGELSDYVGDRIEQLASQFGQYGDERLLLMAALLITDEMLDLRARLAELEPSAGETSGSADDFAVPDAGGALDIPEAVTAPPVPIAEAANADRGAGATDPIVTHTPAPSSPRQSHRPLPRRGSLEARLAQARNGPAPKPAS